MARLFAPRPKEPEKVADPVPPVAPPAPAAGVSKAELAEILSSSMSAVAGQLGSAVNALNERIEALATRPAQVILPPATTAAPAGPTDQQIDQAVISGQNVGASIRALVDRAVTAATERVVKEHVTPLREFGVNTLGDLTRRVLTGKMPHYERYKKEINEQLARMGPPEVQANPAVIELAYNSVVGMHAEELTREAAEAAVRQAQETPDAATVAPVAGRSKGSVTPGTGAGSGQRKDENEVPDAVAVGGAEGQDALRHKGSGGQSQDDFARGMGYKNWDEYMRQYNELLSAETV